jgi:hypothetical protein
MMAYQPFGHTSGSLASSAVALATPIRISRVLFIVSQT